MCLGLLAVLALLLLAVGLPKAHNSLLRMLSVEAMSPGHLKALHDGMHIDVVPC